MAIPKYDELTLPLLKLAAGRESPLTFREACTQLMEKMGLTEDEKQELIPSGGQRLFDNRLGWASTYLKKAGLLTAPKRGQIQITDLGQKILSGNPTRIDRVFLSQFQDFQSFYQRDNASSPGGTPPGDTVEASLSTETAVPRMQERESELSPTELIDRSYLEIRNDLRDQLLDQIKSCSPRGFEQLVLDLMIRMGYGGAIKEQGSLTPGGPDGGIDALIKEDPLGLETIYIQAKRWEASVGRPEIQKFVGALAGLTARKGIFVTTSSFTTDAKTYANSQQTIKLVLMDGLQLADYLMDHGIGVRTTWSYKIKEISDDYFDALP